MPLSFLGNHGYLLYNYVANMLTFLYPKRTGEQGVQGEQGNRGTGRTAKKRKQRTQGNKGKRTTGKQANRRTRGIGETKTYVHTIYGETKGQ